MRIRSPEYPSIGLRKAIDFAEQIYKVSRQNVIDREAAVKDLGYSGLTGSSQKMLANLGHFNLIEKAGKGGVRVTDVAVKIFLPRSPEEKRAALNDAAFSPSLFQEIKEHWPDGYVSENTLRTHLLRGGFATVAIAPALTSYAETYGFLQQEGATESHRQADVQGQTSSDNGSHIEESLVMESRAVALVPGHGQVLHQPPSTSEIKVEGVKLVNGERVVFVEESGPSQYLKVVASGDFDETMLEALEDYIKRQKKRLAIAAAREVN